MRYRRFLFLIQALLLAFPLSVLAVDFSSLNNYLGLCALSKTVTYVSTKGSYAAYVQTPRKFARLCPHVASGTQLVVTKLDPSHWLIQINDYQIQFRLEDLGYLPDRGTELRMTKICAACPPEEEAHPAPSPMASAASSNPMPPPQKSGNTVKGAKSQEEMVIFDFDKFKVKPPYYAIIDKMVAELKTDPKLKVELWGHTCSIGTKKYNMVLSKNRAQAVKKYMVGKGIAANRIVTKGFGYSKPFASNGTPDGRSQNRRVRLVERH